MQRHSRSSKTAALFGKGRKAEAYSFAKKHQLISDPNKIIQKIIKLVLNYFWFFFDLVKKDVLKMISPNKSVDNNSSKQSKDIKSKPNISRKNAGDNWQSANELIKKSEESNNKDSKKSRGKNHKKEIGNITKYIAIDCEMVGIGSDGQEDMLARVSLVNQKGEVLLDKYVKPREPVIDYRTEISGIRPRDIEFAEEFSKVQDEVVNIVQGNILVGHSIKKDLAVLFINHPIKNIRDTSKYKPLAKLVSNGATPSLKRLSKSILGLDIQDGEHDSVIDAKATMAIYNRFSADWEKHIHKLALRQKRHHHHKH